MLYMSPNGNHSRVLDVGSASFLSMTLEERSHSWPPFLRADFLELCIFLAFNLVSVELFLL